MPRSPEALDFISDAVSKVFRLRGLSLTDPYRMTIADLLVAAYRSGEIEFNAAIRELSAGYGKAPQR